MRLSTWIPSFGHASRELAYFTRSDVPESTVRRLTEAAGEVYVGVQADKQERIRRDLLEPPAGPAVQQFSVDGAMVPLVGGEWAEVKTLVVGELTGQEPGEEVRARDLSYFSRLADAEGFTRDALYETHRRGTETADVVVAVNDGAVWEQGFVDYRAPDAMRILDFCHAAGYLCAAAQSVYGPGTSECAARVGRWRHELRHRDPDKVLGALRRLAEGASGEARAVAGTSLEYLRKRREQIRYAEYELLGLPVGSGIVESANKLVVEERLKGSGMHWARHNVDPMLALSTIAFNDRWAEAWPEIVTRLRAQHRVAAKARRAARTNGTESVGELPRLVETGTVEVKATSARVTEMVGGAAEGPKKPRPAGTTNPAPDHPWRRFRFGRSLQPRPAPDAA